MYRRTEYDRTLVTRRVGEFRAEVRHRLHGEPSPHQPVRQRPLSGVYLQLHAYMLRVAIPYGVLSSRQMRRLADVARRYDRGHGHFTTWQNVQFNWPKLKDVPAIVEDLAQVELHAIQAGANTIRTIATDPLAGVAADEIEDPRVHCEIIRHWLARHTEYSHLTRTFKIAVTGSPNDRAAVRFHDIGLILRHDPFGEIGFEVIVGGSQGRLAVVGRSIRSFLPETELLPYLEAILRVCDRDRRGDGRGSLQDLLQTLGTGPLAERVEAEFNRCRGDALHPLPAEIERIARHFALPYREGKVPQNPVIQAALREDVEFRHWMEANVAAHKDQARAIVTISLKSPGAVPGDVSADQMDILAGLADRFSQGEIRVTHEQNLVLPHVLATNLHALWRALDQIHLGTANVGLAGDIVSCPGLDYCGLATTRTIPIAQAIGRRLRDHGLQRAVGELRINISGCPNACGHHQAGHIGILGIDSKGEERFQITLGGNPDGDAALGEAVGPPLSRAKLVDAVESLVNAFLERRQKGEIFIDTVRRLGPAAFQDVVLGVE